MYVIHKYTLEVTDYQTFQIPDNHYPLSVQVQHGKICLWVMVNTSSPKKEIGFFIFGTGNPINVEPHCRIGKFIGTVQLDGFVWHVFTHARADELP